ncbi:MAG: tRNA lysidine(34) synthetase TilS [Polyangiaceae bacterium]|nr:tRNA lysidine(34) synthetase TilS [Polyangiaceae bacterium]
MLRLAERTLREECTLRPGDRILVCVSGGGDSTALLDALARLATRLGFSIHAHGVDHGLRSEAASELELAAELAHAHDVPFTQSRVEVGLGGNLQSRARDARFEALWAAAKAVGAHWLATGHHAEDRAETVVMRLLRGAGPSGLAVLPPQQGQLLRPLIRARKEDIARHLERHGLRYASDPSNLDRRFLRVRVRHEVMPLLESLAPQVVTHLNALADQVCACARPRVVDSSGAEVVLGRAAAAAVARAQARHLYGARIRLPGGREVVIDRGTGRPVVVGAAGAAHRRPPDGQPRCRSHGRPSAAFRSK